MALIGQQTLRIANAFRFHGIHGANALADAATNAQRLIDGVGLETIVIDVDGNGAARTSGGTSTAATTLPGYANGPCDTSIALILVNRAQGAVQKQ